MKKFSEVVQNMREVKEPTGKLKDACWKGYTAVGMKDKNGRKVPNCVPVKEENNPYVAVHAKKGKHETHGSTSYEAAQNAAKHWKMKNTSGISVYRADKTHSTQHVGEQFASDKPEPTREPVEGRFTSQPAKTVTKPAPQATPKNEEVELDEAFNKDKKDPRGGTVMIAVNPFHDGSGKYEVSFKPNRERGKIQRGRVKSHVISSHHDENDAEKAKHAYAAKHGYDVLKPFKANEEVEQIEEMPGANMDTRAVHKHLRKSGWSLTRTKGSHDVYTHPKSEKHIAVPRHKQLKAPLVRGIMKDAHVSEDIEQVEESRGHKILATKLAQIAANHRRAAEAAKRAAEEQKKKEPVKEEEKKGFWQKDTGWKKDKGDTTDKSGAKHSAMSRAKHLAKMASRKKVLEQDNNNQVDNVQTPAKKSLAFRGVVKNTIQPTKGKKVSSDDKFEPEPELNTQIMRNNF